MDLQEILAIIQLATGLATGVASGKIPQGSADNVLALEAIAFKVIAAHKAETGTPMDLSKFTTEEHIDG